VVETFLILRTIQRDIIVNVRRSSCEVSIIHVRLECNLNFLDRFSKNTEMSDFMKICPLGALFQADGQGLTDVMKIAVALHNFANVPRKGQICRQFLVAKQFYFLFVTYIIIYQTKMK